MSGRWNGQAMSVRAHSSPYREMRGSQGGTLIQITRTEYSEGIAQAAASRRLENAVAKKGKVEAHYCIVKEVIGFIEVYGESTYGRIARDLSLNIKAVEHTCKFLEDHGAVQLRWLDSRKIRKVKLMN